ncbi:MAG: protein kinase [Candidatus Brocadiae bacterium]|nr:protein kinase [Candidatus Brocadiia bacterium]
MNQQDSEKKETVPETKGKTGNTFEDLAKSMQGAFTGNAFLRNTSFPMGGMPSQSGAPFPMGGIPFGIGQTPFPKAPTSLQEGAEKPQIEFIERKPPTGQNTHPAQPTNNQVEPKQPMQSQENFPIPAAKAVNPSMGATISDHKPKTANTVVRPSQPKGGPQSKDPLNLLGSKLGGKYEVTKFLGQGGMGAVYAAKHILLGKERAIKFLPKNSDMDENSISRFINEAKAAALVEHPNIVQVHDIEEMDEFYFIIMEYVKGEGVDEILKKEGAMPGPKALDIILQSAMGLGAIHKAGLVHRDIKPANLMRTQEGIIKIADFGIVKHLQSEKALTAANAVLGTPQFMAPEQISNPDIDCRADIYALGSTFFTLVTNRYAFQGSTMQLLFLVMNEPPTPPHEIVPNLDPDISKIILKMMEKNPAKRYQNIQELVQALKNYKLAKKC